MKSFYISELSFPDEKQMSCNNLSFHEIEDNEIVYSSVFGAVVCEEVTSNRPIILIFFTLSCTYGFHMAKC